MTDAAMPSIPDARPDGWPEAFARHHPLAVAAAGAALLCAAPWLWAAPAPAVGIAATAAVIAGVPHGAVDHRVARPLLRPRLGRAWFAAFTVLYLGAAGAVLAGWAVAPAASLLVFLTLSVIHFGAEDANGRGRLAIVVRGGAPVALPILWHPDRTERFFAVLGGTPDLFAVLHLASWAWLAAALAHLAIPALRPAPGHAPGREWVELGALLAVFAFVPPTVAFAFYFLAVHSPRHVAELAERRSRSDARAGWAWIARRSLPLSLATAALGVAVFAALEGTFEERFLRTVFWGLAALTVPHMALSVLDARAGRPPLR